MAFRILGCGAALVLSATLGSPAFSAVAETATVGKKTVDFTRDVQPLLAEHCLACHGRDKAEAGLNLSERSTALAKLDGGTFGIVAGRPEQSELIRRISSHDETERMPPEKKPLKPAEIETLTRWIAEGADYRGHWSFQPLVRPEPPRTSPAVQVRNPIDSFVRAKLEAQRIEPSPEAEPYVLVKRLSLDLTGLLPKPADVDAFVRAYAASSSSEKEKAYAALVDKLLASPHFGERWGRHWLDMARYADSDGYEKDRARPDAYVYRDWVINALNADLPFDRFTIEQLAGDLLPDATPQQKIATAFNRQTLTNEEGGVDQEEYRVNAVFDRTDTLGSVWLGLTVGCAKCHTHKYDPISHTEYYRLFAFFNEADEVSVKLPVAATDLAALERKIDPLEDALQARRRAIAPDEQRWEETERAQLETTKGTPLKLESSEPLEVRARSGVKFLLQKDGSYLVDPASQVARTAARDGASKAAETKPSSTAGDTDTYEITFAAGSTDITGFRVDSIVDPSLPKKSAARAADGNFVVTRLSAAVVDGRGRTLREVRLQRAAADFEQAGFKAAGVVAAVADPKTGWGVAPKVDAGHYVQVRTTEPLTLAKHERLQLSIEQNFGKQHVLGRFKVRLISGDAKELHLPAEVVSALKMYPEKRVAATKAVLFDFYASRDPEVRELTAKIEATYKEFKAQLMPVRTVATPLKSRRTHRFDRGDFLAPREGVDVGTLAVLPPLEAPGGRATRLDLARWLVGPSNPLTPRVVANQVWARLFGAGIVRTASDFGARGEVPSHPELLDWLAVAYRDDAQWSTKRFLKTIVTSATYRQASVHRPELVDVDANNTLLARQNRLRVEGEVVRDLALDVAGLLSTKIGGPSVFPPMPGDLAKLSYAGNFSWTDSVGESRYRRGMYTFFKRTIPHPTLMTFDCPDANTACINRSVSNTPLQALTLLNNESFVEASQSLAKALAADAAVDDRARLSRAVKQCLARDPATEELDRLERLLRSARDYYRNDAKGAEQLIGRYAVASTPQAETAAWVAAVRVLLNLDEFITRE